MISFDFYKETSLKSSICLNNKARIKRIKIDIQLLFNILYIIILTHVGTPAYTQQSENISNNIQTIYVNNDSTLSYKVYVPITSLDQTPSLLILFAPDANSEFAIKQFVSAADSSNTIVACSDQSRNGPYERNLLIFDKMYADIRKKFVINSNSQFLAGFSGGSRLATTVAALHPDVFRGIIGIGAGAPTQKEYQLAPGDHQAYFGIVGQRDMNYVEMLNLREHYDQIGIDHLFLYPNTGHRWSAPAINVIALNWLMSINEKNKPKSYQKYTSQAIIASQTIVDSLYRNNQKLLCNDYIHSFNKALPDYPLDTSLYPMDPDTLDLLRDQNVSLMHSETKDRQAIYDQYLRSLNANRGTDHIDWWQTKYAELTHQKQASHETGIYRADRLINYMRALIYEGLPNHMHPRDISIARNLSSILIAISDQKAYPYYVMAKVEAIAGKGKNAEKMLIKSIENGWNRMDILRNDPLFESVLKRKKLKEPMGG